MLKPIDRTSLSDQVFAQLKEEIISRQYAPGQALPPERELCEMLKVNRSSIREALKRLEQARLIEVRQGQGSIVLDFHTSAGFDLLGDMVMAGGQVNYLAIRSIFEFRSVILPEIAGLAALRLQAPELDTARDLVRQILACREDQGEEVRDLDMALLQLMVQASENLAYIFIINSTRDIYNEYQDFFTVMHVQPPEARGTYQLLLTALEAGDREQARRLYRDIVEGHSRIFFDQYAQIMGTTGEA